MSEIRVIKVEPVNGTVFKASAAGRRPMFVMEVDFHLADGRVIRSNVKAEKKKDVPDSLERAQKGAAAGASVAWFYQGDTGELRFGGVSTSYVIGANGLEPAPREQGVAAVRNDEKVAA